MQQLLEAITIGDIVGFLAALGALWASIRWVRPAVKAAHHFIEDWNGEQDRPGVPGRPGAMQQFADLRSDVADLRSDVADLRTDVDLAKTLSRDAALSAADAAFNSKPNHGSSAYDDLMTAIKESKDDRAQLHGDVDLIKAHLGLDNKEED